METKTSEKGKNITIFILFVILVGLICLLVYTIKFNKTRYVEDDLKIPEIKETKNWHLAFLEEQHVVKLEQDKKNVNVYFDSSLIQTVNNASINNNRNKYIIFNGLNDGKVYALINVASKNVDKPIVINNEGTIIYEFESFIFYGEYHDFKVNDSYTNYGIDTETGLFFVKELDVENKTIYNMNENAFLYYLNVTDNQVNVEYNRVQNGILS